MSIIVSLTTIPSRIDKIHVMIDSLSNQTLKPDKIILYIPKISKRLGTKYIIPESLLSCKDKIPCFDIHFIDDDYGPCTKLIPSIQEFTSSRDILISIDDDVILEEHTFEELIKYHKLHPNDVLCFMGINDGKYMHSEYLKYYNATTYVINDIMGGYRSILYPRTVFENDFFDHYQKLLVLHNNDELPIIFSDDHLWAEYLKYKNVTKRLIGTDHLNWHHPNGWNFKFMNLEDGISEGATNLNTIQSSKIIQDYFSNLPS
jgi:hypothetical protein